MRLQLLHITVLFSAELATGESGGNGDHSQTTIMGPMAMEVDPSKMEEAADDQINTLEVHPFAVGFFFPLETDVLNLL